MMRTVLLWAVLTQAAFGQFTLTRVDAESERPAGAVVDLGPAYPAEAIGAKFRVRNAGASPAAVTTLAVNGTGFSMSGAPKLPVGLGAGEAFEFAVVFQATAPASYSATLETDGVSAILTATVQLGLTNSVGAAGLSFGVVEAGSTVSRRVTIANLTGFAMPLGSALVSGEAFGISGAPPGGTALPAGETTGFDVWFRPAGAGNWAGWLSIGERTYPLSGSAVGASLPKPTLTVELAEARSGVDGLAAVTFDAPARTAGAGTLTLTFEPLAKGAADPAIQLGVVGRRLPFTISAGDTGVPGVNFRTGTTAGKITLAVELGGVTDTKTVEIPAAPVVVTSAAAARTAGAIEVRIAGYDNTRTAGRIEYTFWDSSGLPLPAVAVDNSAEFAAYFAGSDAGGAFGLRAVFPVGGDASQIVAFEARMTNSAGTTVTGRVRF